VSKRRSPRWIAGPLEFLVYPFPRVRTVGTGKTEIELFVCRSRFSEDDREQTS
jgi:hypothetical protein